MNRRALVFFASGAALGVAAAAMLAPTRQGSAAPLAGGARPVVAAGWSWRESATPPPLADAEAAAALDAWLAQAATARPSEHAARTDALRTLLTRLPDRLFGRLVALLAAEPGAAAREHLDLAFSVWVERAPEAATRWAAAAGAAHIDRARSALAAWAARDGLAAVTWTHGLPDEELARRLASASFGALARADLPRALDLALSRPRVFSAVIDHLLTELAKADPAAALRHAPRLLVERDGHHRVRGALRQLARRDLAAALDWITRTPGIAPDTRAQLVQMLSYPPPSDPRAFGDTLARFPELPGRLDTLHNLILQWHGKDPAAPLAWLDSLPDRHLRNQILDRLARTSGGNNPERTLSFALALPGGAERTDRIVGIVSLWAAKDPSAALAWLRTRSEPAFAAANAPVHAAILGAIAKDEPATAVAEFAALTDPTVKPLALERIVNNWAESDPGAALRWFTQQRATVPADEYFPDVPFEIVQRWATREPEAALHWAENHLRDQEPTQAAEALNTLAGDAYDRPASRAATADLFAKIQTPALRTAVLTLHLREWLTKDRAAAQAWLERSDALTPQQAAALLAGK